MTTYSFSLDHAVWAGAYASRAEASEAGLAHAREVATPPETVYVGQRITPDDRSYGHASAILHTMRRRVLEDNGDIADAFLRTVNEKQVADLDNALQLMIKQWLDRQGFSPNWVRYEAISEHPVVPLASVR